MTEQNLTEENISQVDSVTTPPVTPAPETEPVIQSKSQHTSLWKTLSIFLLLVIIAGGALVYYFWPKTVPTTKLSATATPTVEVLPSDKPDNAATASGTNSSKVICTSKDLGVSVTLPDSSWKCGTIENQYSLTASSDKFTFEMSTLGRDEYCTTPDPDPASPRYNPDPKSCEITEFFSNDLVHTKLYTSYGVDHEIFGEVKNGPSVSVSFRPELKETTFTEDEKSTIKALLTSITRK